MRFVWGQGSYVLLLLLLFVCACSVLGLCICACMRVWVCVCVCCYMCMYSCVCVFTCVCIYVCVFCWMGGCLMGQLCVCPICHPTLLTPKGMAERVGNSFWKRERGSSSLMGNSAGFTDGKRRRTPAGCVEANLPIPLTKQLATPVKICLSLPNNARTPLKLCLKWGKRTLYFTHAHRRYMHPGLMSA